MYSSRVFLKQLHAVDAAIHVKMSERHIEEKDGHSIVQWKLHKSDMLMTSRQKTDREINI